VFDGIGPDAEQQLRSRIPVHEGGPIAQADLQTITQAVQDFDSHLSVTYLYVGTDSNGRRTVGLNVQPNSSGREIILPPAFNTGGHLEMTIRIQAQSEQGKFITFNAASTPVIQDTTGTGLTPTKKVTPVYPELAKSARIQGVVRFTATIAPDGTVSKLELISGHPLLVESARVAVLQWVYQPSAAPVTTEITVNFTLQ
jgi:TonB family protein